MPPPATPTRRRLLALLAALQALDPSGPRAGARTPISGHDADPVRRLFAEVQARLAEHERAVARCHRLEAALFAEVGFPRVRLPGAIGQATRHAADPTTIDETFPPGPRRDRLHRVLRGRQRRWEDVVEACGLNQAQEWADDLFQAARDAADALYAVPATSTAGVVLKLLVLLSLELPGPAFRAATPWRELHLILADLGRLSEPM